MDIKKVEDFYDKHADQYYAERVLKGGRLFNEFIEMPTTKLMLGRKIGEKAKVLDIGCGIGSYSKYFADRGAKVTGIDVSQNMLKIAREVCKNNPDVAFHQSSFENFDFGNQKFNYIVGGFMLSYFQNLTVALRKIATILEDGGIVVLSMLHPVRLSIKEESNGLYCFANYFDEDDYQTDIGFYDDVIFLKKWNIEDIFTAAKKSGIFVDKISEPRPDVPAGTKHDQHSNKFYSCPSIMVFRFKKRKQ